MFNFKFRMTSFIMSGAAIFSIFACSKEEKNSGADVQFVEFGCVNKGQAVCLHGNACSGFKDWYNKNRQTYCISRSANQGEVQALADTLARQHCAAGESVEIRCSHDRGSATGTRPAETPRSNPTTPQTSAAQNRPTTQATQQVTAPAAANAGKIIGGIDGLEGSGKDVYAVGWACVTGRSHSLFINLGVAGNEALVNWWANLDSEAAVNQQCSPSSSQHRFRIRLTEELRKSHPNKPLLVSSSNTQLANSGVYTIPELAPELVSKQSFFGAQAFRIQVNHSQKCLKIQNAPSGDWPRVLQGQNCETTHKRWSFYTY